MPNTSENKVDTGINVKTADTEIIGYVESVSPSKQNRRDTTDYSGITLQLHREKNEELFVSQKGKDYFS